MAIKVEVFSTSTCPHCPAAIDAAQKAKDKLGDAIERAIDYQIMAVPTIVVNGDVTFVGAPTEDELIAHLESML